MLWVASHGLVFPYEGGGGGDLARCQGMGAWLSRLGVTINCLQDYFAQASMCYDNTTVWILARNDINFSWQRP